MGFRLGEKGKKALRIGSKVGGIAVALAGAGVLGKKEVDKASDTIDKERASIREQNSRDFKDFIDTGKTRGDIGVIPAVIPGAGGGTATAPIQGAVSKKKAVAGAFFSGVGDVILADSKKGALKATAKGTKKVFSAKGNKGDGVILQQQAVAGAKALAQGTPAVRPKPPQRQSMRSRQLEGLSQQIGAKQREAERKLAQDRNIFGRRKTRR